MVKLSELGITPSPWRVITVNGKLEAVESCLGISSPTVCNAKRMKKADAQIMSAAPDMYDALWERCFGETTTVNCSKCGGNDHGIESCSKTCPLYKSRMALAKASGMIIKEVE